MAFLKWFYPGMRVKRWFCFFAAGVAAASFGLACGSESGVASVTGVRGEERAEEGSPCMGLKAQPQPRTQRGKE